MALNNIFQNIKAWWLKGIYMTNEDAAATIKRLASHQLQDPYEWDDFESITHQNPEVKIALELIFFFAKKFPGDEPAEYCDAKAFPFF